MKFTKAEMDLFKMVLREVAKKDYDEIMNLVGSMYVEPVKRLADRLNTQWYCERHNIRYEDLTEDDRVDMALEEGEDHIRQLGGYL